MNPSKDDIKLLMDTFHFDEAKAVKMIEAGWNVEYMRKGIYDTIDAEVNLDNAISGLKESISESVKKASQFKDDLK